MQFLKRIQPLFLSFTLVACCLTFQSDATSTTANNNYAYWVTNGLELSKTEDVYKIKPQKTENILSNSFSIFSFKCFLRQRKSMFATNYKQQQHLLLPQQADYLKLTTPTSNTEDATSIG
ncbi:MAG: hypothetical protein DA407_03535 [Bacteroidetes bacterium]|nr:MAG: hypothetical protein DA407_03535 [Bacteroidota bacterium]